MPATSVHFNGSVNLPDTDTVMREIARRIPRSAIRRVTDGETGERIDWVFFQSNLFEATGQFIREAPGEGPGGDYASTRQVRLADGVEPHAVIWPDLGYASSYTDSYQAFKAFRAEQVFAEDVRLQLQYPTPLAGLSFVQSTDSFRLVDSYRTALFADLDRALGALPHADVAVQWDVAVEVGMLARQAVVGDSPDYAAVVPGLVACVDQVPSDVPVGMHLCYGDLGHRHFVEPDSLALQVGLINAIVAAADRTVNWFSLTVPQNRSDESYFAPLADLKAGKQTGLSFGIAPYHAAPDARDVSAAQIGHIDAMLAESVTGLREWAVSTECGMGRVDRDDVLGLLDVHRTILETSAQ